jgi:hypothetical protein
MVRFGAPDDFVVTTREPTVEEWKNYGIRSGWLKESGSMVVGSWTCRTCGTDHGEAGCGNYDVDRVTFWVVSDE